ncbi:hypothetical protein DMH27_05335 [Raoultella planticola]|nr:hypothetical protein [Raoultella planticola]
MKLFSDAKRKASQKPRIKRKRGRAINYGHLPDKEMLSDICSLLLINNFNNVISHRLILRCRTTAFYAAPRR